MSKKLYTFLIFFLALTVVCGLVQSLITLAIGGRIYTLEATLVWFIGSGIVSYIGPILLLKYFHYRKYWFAFYTAIVALITNLFYFVVTCQVLISRQLVSHYKTVAIVFLCAGIVYAISLMFSGNKKNFWLKIAGVYAFVVSLILLLTTIWRIAVQQSILGSVTQCTILAASLAPVLLIMHLIKELKTVNTQNEGTSMRKSVENILGGIGMAAFIFVTTFGIMMVSECYSQVYWGKQNFENTKKLARLFEARMFINSKGDTLRYRLLKPLNYDPKKRYPLLVSLPYGGQPGTDTIRQLEGAQAAEILSTDVNRKKYPAFIFVPNCPAGSGWGGVANYPSADTLVYKAISALDTVFSIDAKRRYVTGVSRGGCGSWHFICTRPDMFAAAIPVCGGDDPKLASKIVNVSVWAFHGAKDQNVPVSRSRGMIEGMKQAGLKPRYTEYPNGGHNIWYQVSTTPGLWDWLFAQKRDQ